ncbi:membrane protein [Echinicola rosea]|uniref:Membrane protein n=2 Tax=Echinicola rosea TaxID=1807691 RepID=A0ABQ1V4V4_9BACT|nr:membrane protein [Echinicola rosea]
MSNGKVSVSFLYKITSNKMNIMKNHIYKGIFLAALSLNGCNQELLDQQPSDVISSTTFWQNENDALIGLAGVYSDLQTNFYGITSFANWNAGPKPHPIWDGITDNGYLSRGAGFHSILDGTYSNNGRPEDALISVYAVSFNGIASCNEFLANIDNVTGVSEAQLNAWKGEVLFIRSYYYYYLAATYGDVPIRTAPSTVENQYSAKKPQSEVFLHILNDLNIAIDYLPQGGYDGHVKKAAAQALKAKVLLYNGKNLGEAASAAKSVMETGNYALANDYTTLFYDGEQENNQEVIFSIQYANVPEEAHQRSVQEMIGFWGTMHPTLDLVHSYQCIDGLSISESPLYDSENPMENRDPRMGMSIYQGEWNPFSEIKSETGFTFIKGISPVVRETLEKPINDGTDFIHLRYADVLLMYAEAKIESNDIDQSVLDAINRVRARAYGVNFLETQQYPAVSTMDQTALREELRYERRVEFLMENSRYFDLKRWGLAVQELDGFDGDPVYDRVFKDKHYKWPLPQEALDRNPLLEQNPDY